MLLDLQISLCYSLVNYNIHFLFTDTLGRQVKSQDPNIAAVNAGVNTGTPSVMVSGVATGTNDLCSQNHVGSQVGPDDGLIGGQQDMDVSKNEGTQVGGPLHQNVGTSTKSTGTRTKDYIDDMVSKYSS